ASFPVLFPIGAPSPLVRCSVVVARITQARAGQRDDRMLDESEYERDDAAPIDMLESYYAAHGWTHEREDDEIVAKVKGSWTEYELRAIWREDDGVLQFLAFPDVRVTDERRSEIYEAIGLINEQLWVGHFELWSSSGILLFRHAAMIG